MKTLPLVYELCVTATEHTKLMNILGNPRLTPEEVGFKIDELLGAGTFARQVELKRRQGTTAIRVVHEIRQRFQPTDRGSALGLDGKRRYE